MGLILVTGATGNVGREVVRALLACGIPVRAADRHGDRIRALFGDDVESVPLDFTEEGMFARALEGCSSLFLMRPPAIANVKETLIPFVDEARRKGIGHVVFLSVAGADKNPLVPHHAVEAYLAASDGDWTVLRPGFFAQNCADSYRRDIVEDGRIYVPAGGAHIAFVDVRDVAEVSAIAFQFPTAHVGRAYTLTGPQAVTFEEVARLLSEATGRSIRYQPASILGYVRHLHRRGTPAAQIAVQTILHLGLRFKQAATVDSTLAAILKRTPRSMGEYVRDHAALWVAGGGPTG